MRWIIAIVAFVITFAIVSGILKFLFNVADALLTFGAGAVIALIAGVIALSVAGGAASSTGRGTGAI